MDEFGSLLHHTLMTELDVVKVTNNKDEIIIRCTYCGDSVKSNYSAHFYIQSTSPYMCYCQRCSVKSVVSVSMLEDFGIQNKHLKIETMKMEKNRKFDGSSLGNVANNSFVESILITNDIEIPECVGVDYEYAKLDYVNSRLGLNLTLDDAKDLGMILNFKEFILQNELKINPYVNMDTFQKLHYQCVGFLSQDKNFIVFRSINQDITGFRYYNYNITGKQDNTRKYYTIPSEIDLMDPDITVIITEGIMDLISVYYNVYGGEPSKFLKGNYAFISTNGIGMNLVINTIAKLGFLSPNVLIYSDSEVGLGMYHNIKRRSPYLQNNQLKIHYNELDEDFGVPKERIEVTYVYV